MSERSIQSQTCYKQLRRMVLLGQIPAGERFREVEWAARLGVHRSSLREALSGLAHEGLIRRGERGGFSRRFMNSAIWMKFWKCVPFLKLAQSDCSQPVHRLRFRCSVSAKSAT